MSRRERAGPGPRVTGGAAAAVRELARRSAAGASGRCPPRPTVTCSSRCWPRCWRRRSRRGRRCCWPGWSACGGRAAGDPGRRDDRRRDPHPAGAVPPGAAAGWTRAVRRGVHRPPPRSRPAGGAGPAGAPGCRRRPRRPARPAVEPAHRRAVGDPALLPGRAGSGRPGPGRPVGGRVGWVAGRPGLPTRWSATSRSPSTPPRPAAPPSATTSPRTSTRAPPRWPGRCWPSWSPITPATAADVDARVTLTLDPHRAAPRPADLLAAVTEVARWLPGLETALGWLRGRACSAAPVDRVADRADPGGVRPGRPPRHRPPRPHAATRAGSCWLGGRRPGRRRRGLGDYRHDSGVSVSWALREAPRQAVAARVLAPLLAPGPYPRRVTWLYEPYPADQAAAEVEAAGQRRADPLAPGPPAPAGTRPNATATTGPAPCSPPARRPPAPGSAGSPSTSPPPSPTPTELPAAVADVEQRAGQAKLRLRRLRGAQAAGFAAALGIGINPVDSPPLTRTSPRPLAAIRTAPADRETSG